MLYEIDIKGVSPDSEEHKRYLIEKEFEFFLKNRPNITFDRVENDGQTQKGGVDAC